jgi:ribosomal protein S18 acetylase RimI-like enzyme
LVTAFLRERHIQTGIRPFDPYRDLKAVVDLIGSAFGDKLDPAGQIALEEMRLVARWGGILGWLYWPRWGGLGTAPGFVWVEDERVVGNVSLRRASGGGGFLIGNVAVHPDWRGRGIARVLMEAALKEISEREGRWVGLDVRVDNQVARHLYERLGFQDVGRTSYMLRPAGRFQNKNSLPQFSLRSAERRDSAALIALLHAAIPDLQRSLLELREDDYRLGWEYVLDRWLEGKREKWWVVGEDGLLCGAVRALHHRGRRPDRLEVLVEPDHRGRFEATLIHQGLVGLRTAHKKLVEIMLAVPTGPLLSALEAVGFRESRVLVQMKLNLARRIPVRG